MEPAYHRHTNPRWPARPAAARPPGDTPPAPFAIARRFARGSLPIAADEPARTVYLVRSGQARVFLLRDDGQETTTAWLGPGQLLGIAALLGRPAYHAFAEALTDLEVWALPADELLAYLPRDSALLRLVLDALSRRLTLANGLLRNVALLPVAQRIPDTVARVNGALGGRPHRLTHEALAGLVGARRETVSRAVAAPRAAG
jgi:CRP/FNR family transcriptional regulator